MIIPIINNFLRTLPKDINPIITHVVWEYADWSNYVSLGPNAVAFVDGLVIIGKISSFSDIATKRNLRLISTSKRVDYSHIVKFTELSGGFEQVESNFISRHETKMEVEMAVAPYQMFTEIQQAYISYYLIEY